MDSSEQHVGNSVTIYLASQLRMCLLRVSVGRWNMINNPSVLLLRYGPCQTPTLGFCVERHLRITTFVPEPFWVVRPHISKGGHQLMLEWDRSRLFDREVLTSACLSLPDCLRVLDALSSWMLDYFEFEFCLEFCLSVS